MARSPRVAPSQPRPVVTVREAGSRASCGDAGAVPRAPSPLTSPCGAFAPCEALSSPSARLQAAPARCELFEGDNLVALAALGGQLAGQVDCIYIDPPYNTGATWFAYADRRAGSDAAGRHDAWVDFLRPRLALARALLRDDGAIFVSIDDHEQARLRLLCDEVFGEAHFVAQLVWHKTRKGKALNRTARQVTEYVLCFARHRPTLTRLGLHGSDPDAAAANPFFHRPNAVRDVRFPPDVIETSWPDGRYAAGPQGDPDDSLSAAALEPFEVRSGRIVTALRLRGRFRWTQQTLDDEIAAGTRFGLRRGKFRIVFYRDGGHKAPSTLLDDRCGVGTYEEASAEVTELLGRLPFVYPKPVSLVRYLVRSVTRDRPDAVVLDFFAGTGTTGHAVARLNAEDGGRRVCVLVTDNSGRQGAGFIAEAGDDGICRAICRPRLLRALEREGDGRGPMALRYWRRGGDAG